MVLHVIGTPADGYPDVIHAVAAEVTAALRTWLAERPSPRPELVIVLRSAIAVQRG